MPATMQASNTCARDWHPAAAGVISMRTAVGRIGSASMDYMVVISAVVLGLSVLATLAKFVDWFIHSDPRTMVRTTRWMLLLLLLACIPLLGVAIANQQWSLAMLIGAGLLIVPTLLKWRTM